MRLTDIKLKLIDTVTPAPASGFNETLDCGRPRLTFLLVEPIVVSNPCSDFGAIHSKNSLIDKFSCRFNLTQLYLRVSIYF